MNDQDYIHAGVELADGFRTDGSGFPRHETDEGEIWDHQIFCDALAAQLIRQVDDIKSENGMDPYSVASHKCVVRVQEIIDQQIAVIALVSDAGRTMNTIKAIVDSKVLATADDSQATGV